MPPRRVMMWATIAVIVAGGATAIVEGGSPRRRNAVTVHVPPVPSVSLPEPKPADLPPWALRAGLTGLGADVRAWREHHSGAPASAVRLAGGRVIGYTIALPASTPAPGARAAVLRELPGDARAGQPLAAGGCLLVRATSATLARALPRLAPGGLALARLARSPNGAVARAALGLAGSPPRCPPG